MLKHLLLGAICLCWATTAFSQTNYFHTDNGKLQLTEVNNQFIITAEETATLTSVNPTGVKRYQTWGPDAHPFAILDVSSAMTTDEVVAQLGFDTDEVQVSHGYALSDGYVLYPTRTVVAKLKDKNDLPAVQQLMGQYGIKDITKKYGVYRMELRNLDQVFSAANALHESGLVEFAQPDFYAPIERYQDPLFSQQFQMNNTGQTLDGVTGANDADCNALEAWGITLGSSSITVAVIDDGLEAHEDFVDASGNSRYTAGFTPLNNGNGNAGSGAAHGVSCAGSIAASHNGIGVMGVAPLVNLISVNIFAGNETSQDIADGIAWAQGQGADVMSNSWGYTSCTASFSNINSALSNANSNGRGGLGSVVVFASGNGYKSCVDYPGNNSSVIAVGAFANTGIRSAYSNYGSALDIMAPSNNVGGPGAGVRTTDRMGGNGYSGGNYTSTFGGTSSACPVVSGVAALVLGANPSLTSTQLKNILYSTAIDMGPAGNDSEYANGRVNALAALQAAGGGGGGPTCTDGIQNGQETGVDCGGPSCPSCPPTGCNGTEVTLSITFDNYPEETSWTLTNDAGQTVESGGTYGSQADGSTLTIDLCLVDDCYTFTMNDSYGDGICCSYGNGSYTLSQGGTVLATGSSFGSSQADDFCIGGTGPDTTPPTTPTGLSASNETETTIDLSWNASSDNVGVTGYNVYQGSTLLGNVAGTGATVQSLTACTSYTFSVRAVDAAGNLSGSATTSSSTTGCGGGNAGELGAYYFETGLDGWTDGGGDCYRDQDTRAYEGNWCIRLRDNSGVPSSMTSPTYDLSGLGSVEVSFYFYPHSMENGEDFWLRYNDGSGWQTVATYARGTDFNNGTFYTATVTLSASNFNLTNGARFRFQCDASANGDQVYMDQIVITGLNTSGAFASEGAEVTINEVATRTQYGGPELGDMEFQFSPNPATDFVRITAEEAIEQVKVFSVDGKLLLHRSLEGLEQTTLDVSSLPTGVYLLSVQTEEEVSTERVVIRR